ncbi:hypothetical protein MCCARTNEY_110 [Bacillus phage vB_BanH_McCartney]|nr:hypothetical protein MCCARTNEY_110 [Bacillus phage vB_BanH_McCartney]
MTMAKKNEGLTQEELALYTNYLILGSVENEEDEAKIEEIKQRNITVDEAGTLIKFSLGYMIQNFNHTVTDVMEKVRVQDIVLKKLGANGKVFKDAKSKYKKEVAEAEAQLKAQFPELQEDEAANVKADK